MLPQVFQCCLELWLFLASCRCQACVYLRLTAEPAIWPEMAVDLGARVQGTTALASWDRSGATKTFRNGLFRLPGAKEDARRVAE
jgi:hypothetical protein